MTSSIIDKFLGTTDMTIVSAMEKIDSNTKGILFITDEDRRLIGAITDGDIRRWLIQTGKLDTDISKIINYSPKSINESDRFRAEEIMKAKKLTAMPVINSEGIIKDIIFLDYENGAVGLGHRKKLGDIPVVIMAGGKGTRLYPYTKILPKPLIPVGELPIAELIINQFCEFGCNDYYLVVNYKKNMIKAYFNETEHDYHVYYADEDTPLGTGGGLSLLKGKIHNTFILSNCDILIEEDFNKIMKFHRENKNKITMVCSLKNYRVPYGVVNLGESGSIESMEEKPTVSFFTNTGCYIAEPEVIDEIPDNTEMGFPDIINKYRNAGEKVGVYPISEKSWLDMGQPDTYEDMCRRLAERK
ncbi:MAG: sugar phosphate nucleotidyltransferase [Catonella sp.]|nr:sugar phosphate nucleotidyltransferase [Catonella sp.]MDY6356549.1 sugar phosphate nucleotidyltransferase [Catonella sp.]